MAGVDTYHTRKILSSSASIGVHIQIFFIELLEDLLTPSHFFFLSTEGALMV
jgi:hypothetical protein